jgi:uncharacterized phage protein (TIGR02216 family)
MACGLGLLRLRPADFWAMTPRELALALRGAAGLPASGGPLHRADLDRLMHRFPD